MGVAAMTLPFVQATPDLRRALAGRSDYESMRRELHCGHERVYATLREAREAASMRGAVGMPFRCPKCRGWVLR